VDPIALALEALPKAVTYAGLLLCVGACVARGLLRLRVVRGRPVDTSAFELALSRVAKWASLLVAAALLVRAWGHTAVAFGLAESFTAENLRTIAWESQWGQSWQWQVAVAIGLAIVAQSVKSGSNGSWVLTGSLSVALCYLLPLLGHAEGQPARVLLHGSHILAAGIWVGTLGALVLAFCLSRTPSPTLPQVFGQFSPVAFTGSGLLALTGLVAAWIYVGSFDALVSTVYGRILLLKLFLVSDVATMGFLNWRQFRSPDMGQSSAARRTFVILEALLALAVVVVTAVLTETEH
jgi:putative copper export protein